MSSKHPISGNNLIIKNVCIRKNVKGKDAKVKAEVFAPRKQPMQICILSSTCFGLLLAFLIVVIWFPNNRSMWNLPIQAIDAPSHYYFIRKLMQNGLSVVWELNPNDSFYPPLFHVLVYVLLSVSSRLGIQINIFTGLNLIWLVTSGLLFPIGMLLWCSYFYSDASKRCQIILNIAVPVLSVVSVAQPYWMLNAGPLIAYGLATSILPLLMYSSLRLMDVVTIRGKRTVAHVLRWSLLTIVLGLLMLLAHPRVAFTYLVFIGPFILVKMSKKDILCFLLCIFLAAGLFFAYVSHRDHGKDYLHPSSWFHTFRPTRSLGNAVKTVLTDAIPGLAGIFMATLVCICFIAVLLFSGERFRDALAVNGAFLLTALIFVSSSALTGPVANVITAAWYRGETRPLTMIPLAVVPLLAFGLRCLLEPHPGRSLKTDVLFRPVSSQVQLSPVGVVTVLLLVVVLVFCSSFEPAKKRLSVIVAGSTDVETQTPGEQLSHDKYYALKKVHDLVEDNAVVVSDPLNGSMYGMALYGMDMLYPVYNPMDTKNGQVFGRVERAFASGDSARLLHTVCPVVTSYKAKSEPEEISNKYFLTMGPQSPSLRMFTYKAQYYPFHDDRLINEYEQRGTLVKISALDSPNEPGSQWNLYRFACR